MPVVAASTPTAPAASRGWNERKNGMTAS